MTYLSAVELAGTPYQIHCAISRAFPDSLNGGPGRFLFRIEPDRIIVQSNLRPDWERAGIRVRSCALYVQPVKNGETFLFKLRANPTTRRQYLPDGTRDERRSKPRHALRSRNEQVEWLRRQGVRHGFEIVPDAVRIIDHGTIMSGKTTPQGESRHCSVLYSGRLVVTNATVFIEALRNGIGPAKGFGFGLLTVKSANPCGISYRRL